MKKCISVENSKDMNEYKGEARRRGQNLLIVEGNHEKNELFWLIFRCFPEIHIDINDVWIYGTNIYMLYNDIVKEYGLEWTEDDIDLPFVISKKKSSNMLYYKEDFTNIIMMFDYERHDTNFSESKILEMQNYFVDATDIGKLYINYPMIESYQHLIALPDLEYADRTIPVTLQPGAKYKALVRDETVIAKSVEFPHKIEQLLNKHFGISDEQISRTCCDTLLTISDEKAIDVKVQEVLQEAIMDERLQTAKYQFVKMISKLGYIHNGESYWQYMRNVFQQIIFHNICKANKIQKGQYQIRESEYKDCFERLDLIEILKIQNVASKDLMNGFIWVLNTCIFFVAEYNFELLIYPFYSQENECR